MIDLSGILEGAYEREGLSVVALAGDQEWVA